MNHDIETLLSQPMATLADDDFSTQVMTRIIEQQQAYQKLKKQILVSVILIAAALAVTCLIFTDFGTLFDMNALVNVISLINQNPHSLLLIIAASAPVLYFGFDLLDKP